MRTLVLTTACAALALTACGDGNGGDGNQSAQTPAAKEAAGTQTIAAGLQPSSRFLAVAKSAGLDQTLAGPGPYTVFVPTDAALAAAPAGTLDASPQNRPRVTAVLTNLVLPGTVLAEDLGKAIQAGGGKAQIATMGGGLLTFANEGGKTVLTDASGKKATVTQADQRFTNGIVHQIDALPMPAANQAPASAPPSQ